MLSFRSITDRALDVDPDLRFMALEDFKKCLAPANKAHIEAFVPTLFKLLNDPNPNVQSQALRVFPAIVPYVSHACTMAVVDQLYHDDGPVAALVLRLVLACRYDDPLAAALVANLLAPALARDQLDLIIELVKRFVAVFSHEQLARVARYLVDRAFLLPLSSKCIYGFQMLVARGVEFAPYMAVIDAVPAVGFGPMLVRLRLVLVLVQSCQRPADFLAVYREVMGVLTSRADDLDFDLLVEDHALKEVCLDIVAALQAAAEADTATTAKDTTSATATTAPDQIISIVDSYLHYSTTELDLDSDSDLASFALSDDDLDDDDLDQESYDDGAWKLRYKAIGLAAQMNLAQFMPLLIDSLADKNTLIATAATDAIVAIGPAQHHVSAIQQKILDNLSNETLPRHLVLIRAILARKLQFHREFLAALFDFLNLPKNLDLNENLSLIAAVSHHEPPAVVAQIAAGLVPTLANKVRHSSGNQVFTILKIFDCWSTKLSNDEIFDCLISRLDDDKVLIDLRNALVSSATCYAVHHELLDPQWNEVYRAVAQNLTSESCFSTNLACLHEICTAKPAVMRRVFLPLVAVLATYVGESTSHSGLILSLANQLEQPVAIDKLVLVGKRHHQDGKMVGLVVQNLAYHELDAGQLAVDLAVDLAGDLAGQLATDLVVDLLNSISADDGVEWGGIVAKLPEFAVLEKKLDLSRTTAVRILAVVCVERGLDPQVRAAEARLTTLVASPQLGPEFAQTLQFLSYVHVHRDVAVDTAALVQLLGRDDVPDRLKAQILTSVGLLLRSHSELLVQTYTETNDISVQTHLLNAIKTFITTYHDASFEATVSRLLLDQVNVEAVHKQFQAIGEILALIALNNNDYREIQRLMGLNGHSTGLIYTSLVILNHLVVKLGDEALISGLITASLKYYEIINIDIKIMLTKNLIAVYYHHPRLINGGMITTVLAELKTYNEFKKVIPMGPYKYVIDEGLEIRKLVFEWVYLVVSDGTIDKDLDGIMDVIVARGLLDKEMDILNLSYKSLRRMVEANPQYLRDGGRMAVMVDQLRRNRERKVKSKASKQEVEEYNESRASLEGFVAEVGAIMERNGWKNGEWEVFVGEGEIGR